MDVLAFAGLPTGNICDSNGLLGAMDASIQPLDRHMTMVGSAFPVQCPPGDNLTIHKAILEARPGDVLVVDCGGFLGAGCFGELMATACQVKGIAGIVIDGACRDKNDLIGMGFPTFVKGTCPNGTVKERCGETNVLIFCGGVAVKPGDIIVGDCDGVVVVPGETAEEVLQKAREKNAREEEVRQALRRGITTAELFNLMPKFR